MTRRPFWQYVLVAGALAWVVTTLIQWLVTWPLGHDESQYALAAKDFLAGVEPRWFYLSPGMNVVAVPGLWLGASEIAMRFLPFVVGLGFLATTWLLARRAGEETAAWTVALLAGARPLLQIAGQLLSDVPTTVLMLAAMLVAVIELSREDGPRWRFVAIAPLLAAAFYVRYGSCIPIAVIGIAMLVVWWRPIVRRPLPVLVAAVLFGVLLVPHALTSLHVTGRVTGILLESKTVPGGTFGQGLRDYVTSSPFRLYGKLVPFVLVIGLGVFAVRRDRIAVFFWLVAVGDIVGTGLTTIAQARYIFIGTTLLAILGVDVICRLLANRPDNVRRICGGLALALVAFSWVSVATQAWRYPANTRRKLAGLHDAMRAAEADAKGLPCHIVNRHRTEIEWYSTCAGDWPVPYDAIERGEAVFALRDDTGSDQPDFASIPGIHRAVVDSKRIQMIRIEKAP